MGILPGAGGAQIMRRKRRAPGAIATSNPYKIAQEREKGFRPIAINTVTRIGKTLKPDQSRPDRYCISSISASGMIGIIVARNDQERAF
jgi:hypothetical protein